MKRLNTEWCKALGIFIWLRKHGYKKKAVFFVLMDKKNCFAFLY